MKRWMAIGLMAAACVSGIAQRPKFEAFDVATVKKADPEFRGRFFKMEGMHRFVVKNFTLKLLIAAAYDMNSRTISGGPDWMETERFDVEAVTPGELQPTRVEQMKMLRALLVERFALKFHRQEKEFSIYELTVLKGGPKLRESKAAADEGPQLIGVASPQKITLPARNTTMEDFCAMLQRAILDRPVVDKTGLSARYDFDLEWSPDETQFQGEAGKAGDDAPSSPLFVALREQLGLRVVATKGMVSAMVVDGVGQPAVS